MNEENAISLLKRTQKSLAQSNIKLHKIASNSTIVMKAFPPEDQAKGIKDLDLTKETLPSQRSLGLCWEMESDTFTFQITKAERPFTRRGVLSVVNSLYDPLGLVTPVTIKGRALLREISHDTSDWDIPLPEAKQEEWELWKKSLQDLENLHIQRTYVPLSLSSSKYRELCLFSDASNMAIAAVVHLRVLTEEGLSHVGFILGKAKLTPRLQATIPRLELCAAVLQQLANTQ